MTDWVLAAERAYVAAAIADRSRGLRIAEPAAAGTAAAEPIADRPRALAAAAAIASRYLAVGTPRSFGIIIDTADDVEAAALSLTAHRAWFDPRDVRCAVDAPDTAGAASTTVRSPADRLAAATGGRVVSVDEALASDIVNVYAASTPITPARLRRGTHVNLLAQAPLADELRQLATIVPEAGLPALAAGVVDGRQLDEITIFVIASRRPWP